MTVDIMDLRPGDIGFCAIAGKVGIGISVAQWLLLKTQEPEWKIDHAYVVTDLATAVEAEPGGAREVQFGAERTGPGYVYLRPAYGAGQGHDVARAARGYVGVPYSFADYAAILGLHMGIDNGAVRRYVTSSRHMICSQLADQSLSDAGVHVFNDGRLPQDVTPVDLYRGLLSLPGTVRLG